MRSSVGGNVEEKGGSWVKFIFKVVDELIKYDVLFLNQIFVLVFGSFFYFVVFDLLSIFSKAQEELLFIEKLKLRKSRIEMIDEVLVIFIRSGVARVCIWVKRDVLFRVVDDFIIVVLFYYL